MRSGAQYAFYFPEQMLPPQLLRACHGDPLVVHRFASFALAGRQEAAQRISCRAHEPPTGRRQVESHTSLSDLRYSPRFENRGPRSPWLRGSATFLPPLGESVNTAKNRGSMTCRASNFVHGGRVFERRQISRGLAEKRSAHHAAHQLGIARLRQVAYE